MRGPPYTCTRDYLHHEHSLDGIYDDIANDTHWLEEHVQRRWRCSDGMILNGYRRTYYFDYLEDLVLFKLARG